MEASRRGLPVPDVRVGIRTGDTSQSDRRDIVRHPPDILVTTPESLYLMLTSGAREVLKSVEYVIVDEIHSVAATKRGAHLALSLERLERLTDVRPQRIGLSATQRPLDEVARFLGGRHRDPATGEWGARPVSVVDAGVRKQLELEVIVPVDDMGELGKVIPDVLSGPAAGDPEVRTSIWPAIHPVLLELIRSHTSTLIFVNSRRLAERLAARLNDLAGEELVRAHHGSIAREQRLDIEDQLKAGKLPALVATSSLELGIDMGAIDLVVQVEAPPSVASGLQRIGRAGHQVGQPSEGKIFPKFRGDLVVAAVAAGRMERGQIEETRVPRNPLDVLAQQIVAMCAVDDVTVDEVAAVAAGAYPFSDLSRPLLENVLDMLAGRYPSDAFAELRPRLVWDRLEGTLRARPGARMLSVVSGGTIPDRGLYGVFTPEGSRVGELDEEFVYESRVGETMVLGASTWRIEDITRDRVVVTPAPGEPGKMPFWHGDNVGRPVELGRAIGAFLREVDSWPDARLADECALDAAGGQEPAGVPGRGAVGHRRRAAHRPPDRGRALPRRAGRLAGVPAVALRRAGPRPVGAGHRGPGARPAGPRGADHVERRRHRRPPARGRRGAAPRHDRGRPRRGRGAGGGRAGQLGPVRLPVPGERGPGPAPAPAAARANARPCGRCGSGRPTCWRWRRSTASSRSCWRRTGSACATSSTCPR